MSTRSADYDARLDAFAAEVRRQLAEALEDGAQGDDLRDTLTTGVETLLTCHWCGEAGMPPCACGEDDDTPIPPAKTEVDR